MRAVQLAVLASWLANIPDASAYLMEGAIVYSNEAKQRYTWSTVKDLDITAVSPTKPP